MLTTFKTEKNTAALLIQMEPTNHHLTVTNQHGAQIRGKVVYLQPTAERWRPQTATVHIVCNDWLDAYAYTAVYATPAQSWAGRFAVHAYSQVDGQWRFEGSFTTAEGEGVL